jgi:hypothetical protein
LTRPGYYWLAYKWENLLLSCSACNQRHKKNLFPLADPAKRATSPQSNLEDEAPLFIDPAHHNPEDFIAFREEIAYAIKNNPHGRTTITELGLNREILNEVRRDRLANLYTMRKILDQEPLLSKSAEGNEILREARRVLANAVAASSEFAAMARSAAKRDFKPSLP